MFLTVNGKSSWTWACDKKWPQRDLGDRVNVLCAGAGTSVGQTLGKTGSLWDSGPLIQDWGAERPLSPVWCSSQGPADTQNKHLKTMTFEPSWGELGGGKQEVAKVALLTCSLQAKTESGGMIVSTRVIVQKKLRTHTSCSREQSTDVLCVCVCVCVTAEARKWVFRCSDRWYLITEQTVGVVQRCCLSPT